MMSVDGFLDEMNISWDFTLLFCIVIVLFYSPRDKWMEINIVEFIVFSMYLLEYWNLFYTLVLLKSLMVILSCESLILFLFYRVSIGYKSLWKINKTRDRSIDHVKSMRVLISGSSLSCAYSWKFLLWFHFHSEHLDYPLIIDFVSSWICSCHKILAYL